MITSPSFKDCKSLTVNNGLTGGAGLSFSALGGFWSPSNLLISSKAASSVLIR